jgi:hypothetical protein
MTQLEMRLSGSKTARAQVILMQADYPQTATLGLKEIAH